MHDLGMLPRGNGLEGVPTLPWEMLAGNGTPIASGRAVLLSMGG
jgi:hypothetical protein